MRSSHDEARAQGGGPLELVLAGRRWIARLVGLHTARAGDERREDSAPA